MLWGVGESIFALETVMRPLNVVAQSACALSSVPLIRGVLATAVTATALNGSDRWELVGGRALIPTGARFAVLRFTADRDSGTSNVAWFDKAFLYAVSEAYVPDLGAYGHATHEAAASTDTRILLRFPDMYTDWEKLEPLTIRWETVNNTTRSPVRIDLIQDGPNGPDRKSVV